ncbi:Putative uncharacterized protein [Moritella viscosa]|nr:Putative uncharacterized protein [Moritella viscosa]
MNAFAKFFYSIALCIGTYAMIVSSAQAEIYPFQAKYAVYYKDVKFGSGERILRRLNGDSYKLTTQASVLFGTGDYKNNSWFSFKDNILTTDRYEHETSVMGFGNISSASFEDNGDILMDFKDGHVEIKSKPDVMDVGAMTIVVQNDLKLGKTAFSYEWIFEKKLETIQFEVVQKETINTIFGDMTAVKVKEVKKKKNRATYYWFIPKLDYQLGQVEVYKHGVRKSYLKLTDLTFQ